MGLENSLRDYILFQSTFMKGKTILGAALTLNELVDEKLHSVKKEMMFKVDFKKADNHVNWVFWVHVLV